MKAAVLGAVLALMSSGAALAQAPAGPPRPPGPPAPPARGPSSAVAVEMAEAAIAACAANGYKVTAVVVNAAGVQRVQISADGAPDMTGAVGLRKAFTTITFKEPSGAVGDQAKTDTALADRIKADPKLITWAGGEPLMAGGELIGALGVSGAPGGDKDDACATAAIAKVKGRLG